MKIINFIISLLSSFWLLGVGLLLFLAGFVASFFGAMFFIDDALEKGYLSKGTVPSEIGYEDVMIVVY